MYAATHDLVIEPAGMISVSTAGVLRRMSEYPDAVATVQSGVTTETHTPTDWATA